MLQCIHPHIILGSTEEQSSSLRSTVRLNAFSASPWFSHTSVVAIQTTIHQILPRPNQWHLHSRSQDVTRQARQLSFTLCDHQASGMPRNIIGIAYCCPAWWHSDGSLWMSTVSYPTTQSTMMNHTSGCACQRNRNFRQDSTVGEEAYSMPEQSPQEIRTYVYIKAVLSSPSTSHQHHQSSHHSLQQQLHSHSLTTHSLQRNSCTNLR
jgi:hypothetical protein